MNLVRREFDALGGACELFAVGLPEERVDAVAEWVHAMHRRLTRFDAGSELSALNARAGRWSRVSPELEELLRAALAAYDQSGGLVHAGVLPALLAAGYTRTFAEGPTAARTPPPPPAPLPALLDVRRGAARLAAGAAVDLGGIAKGWLADRAAERLGTNALANMCGDLFATGDGPEGGGWPVGFGDTTVLLRDDGAATSGTAPRAWGEGMHHLVDPRTARPAKTDLAFVSVIASSGQRAEVLAKTALLLGREAAGPYLEGRARGWHLSNR
ncbi:MAG: FAD:protein FMN transferase [Candidatus Limnocylindria bacterium]